MPNTGLQMNGDGGDFKVNVKNSSEPPYLGVVGLIYFSTSIKDCSR